ncbi:hypothetical protein JIV24_13015 [Carboxylicivirga sp. N1Y132]|uniref:Uncharacterized protein n=2 Tax=Carboxylicivirga marina TaxID=2800988 RepID=A0ABS1HKQ7_9BACT|nr:hypothetical protein [uncultured Carboxylicivirga sp.]MBK3518258.1 hypothetical protein [Carboxylicivirga marina]
MKCLITIFIMLLSLLTIEASQAQSAFAVKKWKGRYPRMNNDYPFTFVSWKGWLPPVPHFFVRLYPSHYYYYVNSLPVVDSKSYVNMTFQSVLKLVLKNIDKKALLTNMQEISGIQNNQWQHEAIESFLRDSRLRSLLDIYNTPQSLQNCMTALADLNTEEVPKDIIQQLEWSMEQQVETYLMINKLDAEQGEKLKALGQVNHEIKQLTGTIRYTAQKIEYFQKWNQEIRHSLSFLGR